MSCVVLACTFPRDPVRSRERLRAAPGRVARRRASGLEGARRPIQRRRDDYQYPPGRPQHPNHRPPALNCLVTQANIVTQVGGGGRARETKLICCTPPATCPVARALRCCANLALHHPEFGTAWHQPKSSHVTTGTRLHPVCMPPPSMQQRSILRRTPMRLKTLDAGKYRSGNAA